MPPVPKYSDRINFLFVISGKTVPVDKKLHIFQRVRAVFSPSKSVHLALQRAASIGQTIGRYHNTAKLLDTSSEDVNSLCDVLRNFVVGAARVMVSERNGLLTKLWTVLGSTVAEYNGLVQRMNDTFLARYGRINAENLRFKDPIDFLDILPVAHKILGQEYKWLAHEIMKFEKPLKVKNLLCSGRRGY